ncbi:MAG: hypothetical protein HYY91_03015 [Candidatus Omnitrophica bacterium]|nr:hypothetical protein [Candidatus Omnitrophota bacterium]
MTTSTKNPWVAAGLSLAPGLGQLYNGQRAKAWVLCGACLALVLATTWLAGISRVTAALALFVVWTSAIVDAYKTAQMSGRPLDWYYRRPYVVAMLLLLGPVALPLLWRSPHFSAAARWTWTTVVLGAVLLFLATPYLINRLLQQMPELDAILRQSGVQL